MNMFSKVIAGILTVMLLFFVPMMNYMQQQDSIMQSHVQVIASDFVTEITSDGCISPDSYDRLIKKLNDTGNLYTVTICHNHVIVNPDYAHSTSDSIYTTDLSSYTVSTYTDAILEKMYNSNDSLYHLSTGDYVSVVIKSKTKTTFTKLRELFYNTSFANDQIVAQSGGEVRNETD